MNNAILEATMPIEDGELIFKIYANKFGYSHSDRVSVGGKKGDKTVWGDINPEDFVSEHYMPDELLHSIGAVQVFPRKDFKDEYRMIMATSNSCCYGAVFSIDLMLKEHADGKYYIEDILRAGEKVPLCPHGIVGIDDGGRIGGDALVWGQGCCGHGVRYIDLAWGDLKFVTEHTPYAHLVVKDGRIISPYSQHFQDGYDIKEMLKKVGRENQWDDFLKTAERSAFLYKF